MHPLADLDPAPYRLPPEELERLFSPALVLYLDVVRENLRRMLRLVGSAERWRPHVKTSKTPALFAELLAAGLGHFKCATLREARCLLEAARSAGRESIDVLIAYPLVGPALRDVGRLRAGFPAARLSILCEDPAVLPGLAPGVGVFVEVDPGMGRTGLALEDRAAIRAVARGAGDRLRGIHFYEGHLHGPEAERREQCFACYRALLELADELERAGHPLEELVTSGTPGFLQALAFPDLARRPGTVHRVSPGTVVLHDLRSAEENSGLDLLPAALVLARVVSRTRADRVTCDAGSKSLAAEAGDPCALALGWPGLEAERPSEEHLPLRVRAGPAPPRGEALLLVPRHVCPTVNLAEQALLVEGGVVRDVVPVSARAHDLRAPW